MIVFYRLERIKEESRASKTDGGFDGPLGMSTLAV